MNDQPDRRRYQLADYEFVFEAAERSQAEVVLVGGQAVYGWAVQYQARCPALNQHLPYTSKDADYFADVSAALKLAQALNSQFRPTPQKGGMRGLCLGEISLGGEKKLEILGQVNGVKTKDLHESAVYFDYQGKMVKVIHPIQLFIGKGHNVIGIDQTHRQDGKHFAIMQLVVRQVLADLAAMGEEGVKALLKSCALLIDFIGSEVGLKLIVKGHLSTEPLWPDLSLHPSEKLQNFVRQRVPRWEQRLAADVAKLRQRMQP